MEEDDEGQRENLNENSEDVNTISKETNKTNIYIQKLITILNIMSIELPLNNLAEKIESETGGKFTFKEFHKIIDKYYKKLTKKEKKDFIKYISLSSIDINIEKPYITSFSLFNYFSNLLTKKIHSPSLVIYEIANRIKNTYKKSTLEFFISNKIQASGEINLEELINFFYKKLNIDEITTVIFFNIINYNKKSKIKIEDIILTIDSFRDDNWNNILNDYDKNILFLNIILDKNFINIDKIFKETEGEYINLDDLKKKFMKEINKNSKYNKANDKIDENILNDILLFLSKDEKINKEEFKKNYLEAKNKLKNKKLELNINQKYWINKYIDTLSSIGITPQTQFKLILEKNNNNGNEIELNELKNELLNNIIKLKINRYDLDNIIKTFDINCNGNISFTQYEYCINQVLKEKEGIMKLEYNNNINFKKEEGKDNNITNIWSLGIIPENYY